MPHKTTVERQRIPPAARRVKAQIGRATGRRVRIRLIELGWTVTDLARKTRRTRNYTSLVVHGHQTAASARKRIARTLGMDVQEAWPERRADSSQLTANSRARTDKDEHGQAQTGEKRRGR